MCMGECMEGPMYEWVGVFGGMEEGRYFTCSHTDGQIDGEIDRQAGREAGRQTDKQTSE